jgi:metal-responsive CopG/Arc/MetJ family transcriptional regulator
MWSSVNPSVQKETITKKRVNICVDKNLYERFKVVADKDMRKYSNILEGAMRRYVQSRI